MTDEMIKRLEKQAAKITVLKKRNARLQEKLSDQEHEAEKTSRIMRERKFLPMPWTEEDEDHWRSVFGHVMPIPRIWGHAHYQTGDRGYLTTETSVGLIWADYAIDMTFTPLAWSEGSGGAAGRVTAEVTAKDLLDWHRSIGSTGQYLAASIGLPYFVAFTRERDEGNRTDFEYRCFKVEPDMTWASHLMISNREELAKKIAALKE